MPHKRHAHALARCSRCKLRAIGNAKTVKVQPVVTLVFPINSSRLQVSIKLYVAGEHSFENQPLRFAQRWFDFLQCYHKVRMQGQCVFVMIFRNVCWHDDFLGCAVQINVRPAQFFDFASASTVQVEPQKENPARSASFLIWTTLTGAVEPYNWTKQGAPESTFANANQKIS